MPGRARDAEPPAVLAVAAVVLGCVAFYQGLIIPAQAQTRHVVLGAVFGLVCVAAAWRALTVGRRRRAARVWAWIGLVLGAVGLGMLLYQVLVIVTGGAVPPPFWAPYARR
jgi:multisubunit Na+/H+ antiporter MnhE subunit